MTYAFPIGINLGPLSSSAQPPDRREFVDPQTNLVLNSRLIDPLTGDFVLGSDGNFQGMPSSNQQVYLAIQTALGSSSQSNLGNSLKRLKIVNVPNFNQQVANIINQSLSSLISSGAISLNSVIVQTQPMGVVIIQVFWTDLSINQEVQTSIPLQPPIF